MCLSVRKHYFSFVFEPQVRESFCKTLEDMCKDWLGKIIDYKILFECLKPGCKERYPLDLCHGLEKYHHCNMHDINLNTVRELFGTGKRVLRVPYSAFVLCTALLH